MIRCINRRIVRLAIIGTMAAALGLAGCGRKGALDPPPSASIAEPAEAAPPAAGPGANMNPMAAPAKPMAPVAFGSHGEPIAPKGPKRPLFLDWFID